MKAIFVALLAFAASAIASPVIAERQLETQEAEIDKLTDLVKLHTANINKTASAAPNNPDAVQQTAAASALAPDFQAITTALKSATTVLSKRAFASLVRSEQGGCGNSCLLIKVQLLVWEISCTLKFVIIKLGLACVLVYLTPLILALGGLLKCLDAVVAGLLFAVKGILSAVLGTVAGALVALII
ncbi:hypothetical protein B0T22DRAFT_484353 [Podospora appendiculata]|uniref:Uncharacterized protein n=1 Tax=Podospora appendiculata TaxID=314037 RepID=A0AAE0X0P2_9PEZI|nr:hypothetical protein B0T22DRAFT_484353 [Podospora appendiculata]